MAVLTAATASCSASVPACAHTVKVLAIGGRQGAEYYSRYSKRWLGDFLRGALSISTLIRRTAGASESSFEASTESQMMQGGLHNYA